MHLPAKTTKKELLTAFRTQEILAAARRVMGPRGLEGVTMDEIAAAAGVAKGTIYLYFAGKEDLIQALMTQVGEQMLLGIKGIMDKPGSPREKLTEVVSLFLAHLEREQFLFTIYVRDSLSWVREVQPGPVLRTRELEEKIVGLLTQMFAEGIAAEQFMAANPRLLTFLFRGLIRAVGFYRMAEGQEQAIQEALPVLVNLLSSGLVRQAKRS